MSYIYGFLRFIKYEIFTEENQNVTTRGWCFVRWSQKLKPFGAFIRKYFSLNFYYYYYAMLYHICKEFVFFSRQNIYMAKFYDIFLNLKYWNVKSFICDTYTRIISWEKGFYIWALKMTKWFYFDLLLLQL